VKSGPNGRDLDEAHRGRTDANTGVRWTPTARLSTSRVRSTAPSRGRPPSSPLPSTRARRASPSPTSAWSSLRDL